MAVNAPIFAGLMSALQIMAQQPPNQPKALATEIRSPADGRADGRTDGRGPYKAVLPNRRAARDSAIFMNQYFIVEIF